MIITVGKIRFIPNLIASIVIVGLVSPAAIANQPDRDLASPAALGSGMRSPLDTSAAPGKADQTASVKPRQVLPGQVSSLLSLFEPPPSYSGREPSAPPPIQTLQPVNLADEFRPVELTAAATPVSTLADDLKPIQSNQTAVALPLPSEAPLPIAQAADEADGGDLAAASQNPIADLISVPFQNNTNFGVGPFDRTQNVLNIQPVYPFDLSEDLLLVTRTIVPIVTQPDIDGGNHIWGLGDINPTFLLVPRTESNVTWGVGPTFGLPTATDTQTGTGKWSVGPAGVVVVNSGPWVYGALASQFWSFAGDSDRPDVNQFVTQPFFNYNLPNGWYLVSSPIISANWNASGEQWTLPIGGGFGRVFNIGRQPVNAQTQFFWNAIAPEGAADFTLRFQLTLLFPQ